MERWVEHYTELYASENVVTEDALNAIECRPELEELDREPTIDELSEALDSLASGKAPGKDGIPAEVLKCCKETLITELHEILCLFWSEGEVPQDMRDANVITLYKNKGDRGDCNNYRGISLLSVVGKVFGCVVLKSLQVLAEQVYPESQCGFHANRSTVDMIMCKRDLKALNIDQNNWEATALRRSAWRQTVQNGLSNFEETLAQQHREKRMRRMAAAHANRPASDFVCVLCHRDCHSCIRLVSHTRRCTRKKHLERNSIVFRD